MLPSPYRHLLGSARRETAVIRTRNGVG